MKLTPEQYKYDELHAMLVLEEAKEINQKNK